MVAIKIQSLRDVARVYLQTSGYGDADVSEEDISFLLESASSQTAEEFICKADEFAYGLAKEIFGKCSEDKSAETARFKLTFSLCGGAGQCSVKDLVKGKLSDALKSEMKKRAVINAPEYRFEEMKPQTIDEVHWIRKMFSRFKKD